MRVLGWMAAAMAGGCDGETRALAHEYCGRGEGGDGLANKVRLAVLKVSWPLKGWPGERVRAGGVRVGRAEARLRAANAGWRKANNGAPTGGGGRCLLSWQVSWLRRQVSCQGGGHDRRAGGEGSTTDGAAGLASWAARGGWGSVGGEGWACGLAGGASSSIGTDHDVGRCPPTPTTPSTASLLPVHPIPFHNTRTMASLKQLERDVTHEAKASSAELARAHKQLETAIKDEQKGLKVPDPSACPLARMASSGRRLTRLPTGRTGRARSTHTPRSRRPSTRRRSWSTRCVRLLARLARPLLSA